jgi:hypothetical protein
VLVVAAVEEIERSVGLVVADDDDEGCCSVVLDVDLSVVLLVVDDSTAGMVVDVETAAFDVLLEISTDALVDVVASADCDAGAVVGVDVKVVDDAVVDADVSAADDADDVAVSVNTAVIVSTPTVAVVVVFGVAAVVLAVVAFVVADVDRNVVRMARVGPVNLVTTSGDRDTVVAAAVVGGVAGCRVVSNSMATGGEVLVGTVVFRTVETGRNVEGPGGVVEGAWLEGAFVAVACSVVMAAVVVVERAVLELRAVVASDVLSIVDWGAVVVEVLIVCISTLPLHSVNVPQEKEKLAGPAGNTLLRNSPGTLQRRVLSGGNLPRRLQFEIQ